MGQEFGRSPLTPWRLYTAIGLAALGVVLCVASVVGRMEHWEYGLVAGLTLLLAPLLGCGGTVLVTRNSRGEAVLVKNTWVCFYPVGTQAIYLEAWEAMYYDASHSSDGTHYRLNLGRDRRGTLFTVYQGDDEGRMHGIADAIRGLTGMPLERM